MVSLEISYYPCLFHQTKFVPGIKYRKLRHEENNYYESDESVHILYYKNVRVDLRISLRLRLRGLRQGVDRG